MKVIYLNRFFFPDRSATSQILSELVFELAERGYDIHVIASRLNYEGGKLQSPGTERLNGVTVHRIYSSAFGRRFILGRLIDYLTFYLSCVWIIFKIMNKDDIIVAKTDPPLLSLLLAPIVKLKNGRLLNWLQDIFPEVASRMGMGGILFKPLYSLLRWFRNKSLSIAEINIVPGKLMAEHLCREGIAEDRLHVIPNWSDGKTVYPVAEEENHLRKEWNLNSKFVVGYSGNFGLAHEFDGLMEAANILAEQDRDIVFLFIGGGKFFERLDKTVEARNISNIHLKPYQNKEDLAQSLSVPDVHLVSLKPELEGLLVPSKFYGIAAAGRATIFIGDQKGEIPALLNESQTGIIVPPGNGKALATAITGLKDDIESCQKMGQQARSIFMQRYEKKYGIQRWDVLLSNIVAEIEAGE